jgi:uncharacterized protein YhfF
MSDEPRGTLPVAEFGFPGELRDRLDSSGAPVAVIEIEDVRVLRLADVDIAVARDEGEGFRTVAEWRRDHEAFWNSYADELRSRLGDPSWRLEDETPVVVERFRLMDPQPARVSATTGIGRDVLR